MSLIEIDRATCTKCGICAAACPGGIILFFEGKFPRAVSAADQACARCGHCVTVCPSASIVHAEIPTDECPVPDASLDISFEQAAQLISKRRSIRVYRDERVPREEITRIIDIARYAPTGHNGQEIRWLVIDDKDKLRRFEEIGLGWMKDFAQQDPMMAEMLAGAIKRMEAGVPVFLRDAPALVIVHADAKNSIAAIDGPIALTTFDLAANAAGLGCCWAGFFMMAANTFPALKEAVALPEDQKVYGAMMLGYPTYSYQRIPTRLPARITWG